MQLKSSDMKESAKWIDADEVQRAVLREKCNCSADTVNKALAFKRNGPVARAVRTYAVNFLGCLIYDVSSRYL